MQTDRDPPTVAADGQGHVFLAWASQTGENERTIWLAVSADDGSTFAPPKLFRKVAIYRHASKSRGKEMSFASYALPRLAATGRFVYLGWLEPLDGGPRGAFYLARSTDGGQTFSEPLPVHGTDALRPAYSAFAVGADDFLACAWLESRNKAPQPFCSTLKPGGDALLSEVLVHARPGAGGICPCCDLAAARAADGTTFVAFRNAEEGYRDIYVARSRAGVALAFEAPVAVTPDHWPFDGCPHDGPALAVSGDRLHVLWMDAHTGRHRLYHAHTALSPLAFTVTDVDPQAPGEQGHPRLAADAQGGLHAVWDASLQEEPAAPAAEHGSHTHGSPLLGSGRVIRYARATGPDQPFQAAQALAPAEGVFQLRPSLCTAPGGTVHVAWQEITTAGKSIVFARLARPTAATALKN